METRGREWSDLSALQGMPNVARSPLELGERRGWMPLGASRRGHPCRPLVLRLLAPRTRRENKVLWLYTPQLVLICHGAPGP